MTILALLFFISFSLLAWRKFNLALGFFIIFLPAYLIRPTIFGLPTTILEIAFGALFLVWIIKYFKTDKDVIVGFLKEHKFFTTCFIIFFLASTSGIFISDMWWYSLGQWRAYFLEPMILFLIILGRRDEIRETDLVTPLTVSSLSVSLLAIWQKVMGSGFPPSLWDDFLDGRVVSFFTTPNAIGLYLAPILFLPIILMKDRNQKWLAVAAMPLAVTAILFSRSIGAWLALAVGVLAFVWLMGFKKLVVGAVLLVLIIPVMFPFVSKVFGGKSGANRLMLWSYSQEFLTASPKNFVFGAGIRQFFRKVQKPHYDAEELERLIYPHNIFLNFWTEIGLAGMLSFVGLFGFGLYAAAKKIKQNRILGSVLVVALLVFFVHGLVDVPYFKNDLAFLFWIIFSLAAI
ncbi:MAG: O-antigen ligase family protein [bacterium]|nr:O-antigen ligase family protein [bacterium]